ncbi:MAG: serine O-acetyltransferase [Aliarcobacter sp.]|jgi:serine O-acetyltransferase|nr:serine O-acetyltransferase [Aliarcobacter sp.]
MRLFIKSDLYRYTEQTNIKSFIKAYLSIVGFNYLVWFRITQKYNNFFTRFLLKRKMIKFGIEIHPNTKIGYGFYIGHFGGIVVNEKVIIGNNCNISQGVTIGQINRGVNKGTPIIEDEVYIGPGAKILGKILIKHNSAIGSNAVVIKDVTENTTVGGIPAKQISILGSEGYINRTWKIEN